MVFIRERYKNYENMTMEDYQKYVNEADLGYIKINKHPEDENIVILNYTELVQFERRWNDQTKSARGLILDLTDATDNGIIYILAKPFDKFPNYGENLDYESDIDFNDIETVMEKMDGSLGISYMFDGKLRFATRGSFTSEQAIKATEMWHNKYAEANMKYNRMYHDECATLLVEIIYPENRVVVDYKGEEKLVLLGVMDEGRDLTHKAVKFVGEYMKLPVVPTYNYNLEQMLKMKKIISANQEGWIVRFRNGKRLKIKGDEYLQVHRIKHGMSDKAKFKAWSEDKLQEYIMLLPEEFRAELEEFGEKLDKIALSLHTIFSYKLLELNVYQGKREFAIKVNEEVEVKHRKFMFEAYKHGEVPMILIKEHIYKNYNTYLEMI